MSAVGWFLLGAVTGSTVGLLTAALCSAAGRADTQIPHLAPGVWLVDIDPAGDCVSWVRQPVDLAGAAERLIRLHEDER